MYEVFVKEERGGKKKIEKLYKQRRRQIGRKRLSTVIKNTVPGEIEFRNELLFTEISLYIGIQLGIYNTL